MRSNTTALYLYSLLVFLGGILTFILIIDIEEMTGNEKSNDMHQRSLAGLEPGIYVYARGRKDIFTQF